MSQPSPDKKLIVYRDGLPVHKGAPIPADFLQNGDTVWISPGQWTHDEVHAKDPEGVQYYMVGGATPPPLPTPEQMIERARLQILKDMKHD